MNIKTKFDVGEKVWFFKDWHKAKRRILFDITAGTVIDIKTCTGYTKTTNISYMIKTADGYVEVYEPYLQRSYPEITALASDRNEQKENDSVKEAYERLGRELGLI